MDSISLAYLLHKYRIAGIFRGVKFSWILKKLGVHGENVVVKMVY